MEEFPEIDEVESVEFINAADEGITMTTAVVMAHVNRGESADPLGFWGEGLKNATTYLLQNEETTVDVSSQFTHGTSNEKVQWVGRYELNTAADGHLKKLEMRYKKLEHSETELPTTVRINNPSRVFLEQLRGSSEKFLFVNPQYHGAQFVEVSGDVPPPLGVIELSDSEGGESRPFIIEALPKDITEDKAVCFVDGIEFPTKDYLFKWHFINGLRSDVEDAVSRPSSSSGVNNIDKISYFFLKAVEEEKISEDLLLQIFEEMYKQQYQISIVELAQMNEEDIRIAPEFDTDFSVFFSMFDRNTVVKNALTKFLEAHPDIKTIVRNKLEVKDLRKRIRENGTLKVNAEDSQILILPFANLIQDYWEYENREPLVDIDSAAGKCFIFADDSETLIEEVEVVKYEKSLAFETGLTVFRDLGRIGFRNEIHDGEITCALDGEAAFLENIGAEGFKKGVMKDTYTNTILFNALYQISVFDRSKPIEMTWFSHKLNRKMTGEIELEFVLPLNLDIQIKNVNIFSLKKSTNRSKELTFSVKTNEVIPWDAKKLWKEGFEEYLIEHGTKEEAVETLQAQMNVQKEAFVLEQKRILREKEREIIQLKNTLSLKTGIPVDELDQLVVKREKKEKTNLKETVADMTEEVLDQLEDLRVALKDYGFREKIINKLLPSVSIGGLTIVGLTSVQGQSILQYLRNSDTGVFLAEKSNRILDPVIEKFHSVVGDIQLEELRWASTSKDMYLLAGDVNFVEQGDIQIDELGERTVNQPTSFELKKKKSINLAEVEGPMPGAPTGGFFMSGVSSEFELTMNGVVGRSYDEKDSYHVEVPNVRPMTFDIREKINRFIGYVDWTHLEIPFGHTIVGFTGANISLRYNSKSGVWDARRDVVGLLESDKKDIVVYTEKASRKSEFLRHLYAPPFEKDIEPIMNPETLDPLILKTIEDIWGSELTQDQKSAYVIELWKRTFMYDDARDIVEDLDFSSLSEFVTSMINQGKGTCAWAAMGGCAFLRAIGTPVRVVTGAINEPYGAELSIKELHAMILVWNFEKEEWVLVEPQGGLGTERYLSKKMAGTNQAAIATIAQSTQLDHAIVTPHGANIIDVSNVSLPTDGSSKGLPIYGSHPLTLELQAQLLNRVAILEAAKNNKISPVAAGIVSGLAAGALGFWARGKIGDKST
jgi:hypothetical protein